MEKNNLQMIINDLRSRRDALSLAHDNLEIESDNWNKAVIVISLMTGMLESIKLRMNWTSNVADLIPIAFSSIIACVSALIKFKNIPSQMEILLQSQSLLTHTLTNARNEEEITPNLLIEYHESLEKLEVSLYPDIRKKILVQSHKNLISVMKKEQIYFNNIKSIADGSYTISSSDSSIASDEIELKNQIDNI